MSFSSSAAMFWKCTLNAAIVGPHLVTSVGYILRCGDLDVVCFRVDIAAYTRRPILPSVTYDVICGDGI